MNVSKSLTDRVRGLAPLAHAQSGVAMVEFALIAPVLMMVIVASLELANYALALMRVSQIAMTVADNAGRIPTGIDESDVYQTFEGANVIGQPISFKTRGRIVLSSLEDNKQNGTKKGQYIRWQRCYGDMTGVVSSYGVEGAGKLTAALPGGLGPTGRKIKSSANTAVMFVEVTYQYQPLIGSRFMQMFGNIRYESAFNVRGRVNQAISNTSNRPKLTC